MTFVTRLGAALLVAATGLTGIAATPVTAQTAVTVQYRDVQYRDRDWDRRDDRNWRGDRHWRDDRRRYDRRDWDRRDRRYSNRGYYGYARQRCWTDWRYDRWSGRRVAVRVCR